LFADRRKQARYTHLIRSADDGEQETRSKRTCGALAWKLDFHPGTHDKWKALILELLADRTPRTFNRIVLELTGYVHTADTAFEKSPDHALWELVEERKISHTLQAPILFRRTR
jgi:hypothetical protein